MATATKETCNTIPKHLSMRHPSFLRINQTYGTLLSRQTAGMTQHFSGWWKNFAARNGQCHVYWCFVSLLQHIVIYTNGFWWNYYDPLAQDHIFEGNLSLNRWWWSQNIEARMKNPTGSCWVLFSTTAFGMGVDIAHSRTVIHCEPSTDMDGYPQELVRMDFQAALFCTPILAGHISPTMKTYVTNSEPCRHSLLCQSFVGTHTDSLSHHSCCDVCTEKCPCATQCSHLPVCAELSN